MQQRNTFSFTISGNQFNCNVPLSPIAYQFSFINIKYLSDFFLKNNLVNQKTRYTIITPVLLVIKSFLENFLKNQMKTVLSVECLDFQKLAGWIVSIAIKSQCCHHDSSIYPTKLSWQQSSIGNLKNSLCYLTNSIFWFVP